MPLKVEVLSQPRDKGGYLLVIGENRFWFPEDPDVLAGRLERWFRYYFRDFRPRVAEVYGWPSYAKLDNLRSHHAARCPECRRDVRVRVGEVGAPV